jgi:flagellar export protein FliJ
MAPKFSLQNVLDIRHGKVELLEIELGRLLTVQQQTQELLSSLQGEQAGLLELLNAAQVDEIDLFEINALRSNILYVNQRIDSITLELARQNQEIAEQRAALVKAKQDEETLEILKKKRHEIYLAEQLQVEARLQDDIYIARAFRQQQQGA